MPINVGYEPPFAIRGQLAYGAGKGKFLQSQDAYNEKIRQFEEQQGLRDRAFDEQTRQFNLGQRYKYDALRSQEGLQYEQLYQRGQIAQAEAALRAQSAAALDRYRMGTLGVQQQGQQATQDRFTQTLEAQERQRMHAEALDSAKALGSFTNWKNPEQEEQAWAQFDKQYPFLEGRRPYYKGDLSTGLPPDVVTMDEVQGQLSEAYGYDIPPHLVPGYGTIENGEFMHAPKLSGAAQAYHDMQMKKLEVAEEIKLKGVEDQIKIEEDNRAAKKEARDNRNEFGREMNKYENDLRKEENTAVADLLKQRQLEAKNYIGDPANAPVASVSVEEANALKAEIRANAVPPDPRNFGIDLVYSSAKELEDAAGSGMLKFGDIFYMNGVRWRVISVEPFDAERF